MRTRILFVCLTLGSLSGCRTEHLGGDSYGKRSRSAFRAQAEGGKSDAPAPQSSDDARRVMAAHRGKADKGATTAAPQSMSSSVGGPPSAQPNPAETGSGYNPSPMRIDAK